MPTYRYKLAAFALSCFIAGLIGGIHTMFVQHVTVAETFAVGIAVDAIMMAALGGTAFWYGPALGAVIVTAHTQSLTDTVARPGAASLAPGSPSPASRRGPTRSPTS